MEVATAAARDFDHPCDVTRATRLRNGTIRATCRYTGPVVVFTIRGYRPAIVLDCDLARKYRISCRNPPRRKSKVQPPTSSSTILPER